MVSAAGVAGSQKGATRSMAAPMTHASLSKRRGQGEDSIYWDASKNRYVGAVSLGFSPAGTRIRKKVTGRPKTEVRDKLRELHKQVEGGLRQRRRYTVEDALEDWLADGVSARTVTLYRGTIAKALRESLGSVRLTELTAGDVQGTLAALASRSSTRTVQIAHNVLVRAIRHAERDDLVRRNVVALVKPPKGQLGGLRTKEARALRWDHVVAWVSGQWQPVAEVGFDHEQVAVFVWRAGHNQTATTEPVYRHQIVPALTRGAEVMDQIFG